MVRIVYWQLARGANTGHGPAHKLTRSDARVDRNRLIVIAENKAKPSSKAPKAVAISSPWTMLPNP